MIFYIAGSAAEQTATHYYVAGPLLSTLALYAYMDRPKKNSYAYTMGMCALLVVFYLAGMFCLRHQKEEYAQFHAAINNKMIDIAGTVADIESIAHRLFSRTVLLENVSIRRHDAVEQGWIRVPYKVQIYTNATGCLAVADRVFLNPISVKTPAPNSYQTYLIKENIGISLFIPHLDDAQKETQHYSLKRWISTQKHRLTNALKAKMSKKGFSIFSSLFLGKKESDSPIILQNNRETFATWGISHYLARSGLHLVVLITLWLAIFSLLPLSFNAKQVSLVVIGIAYLVLSWSSIPFYRALATFVLHRVCLLLRLQSNPIHLLTATCLFILLANPVQLFFLDFQLSFGLTFALACFTHIRNYQQTEQYQTIAMRT